MVGIKVCMGNLFALQERRYAIVYVAVTKFVRTMLRLIILSAPRYFWIEDHLFLASIPVSQLLCTFENLLSYSYLPIGRDGQALSSRPFLKNNFQTWHDALSACLLLALHSIGAILKPMYASRGLNTNLLEFVTQLNATEVVAND